MQKSWKGGHIYSDTVISYSDSSSSLIVIIFIMTDTACSFVYSCLLVSPLECDEVSTECQFGKLFFSGSH